MKPTKSRGRRVATLKRAREQWEWHAHRDQWLARLAETGQSPLRSADPRLG